MAKLRLRVWEASEDLPPVCMACGAPATATRERTLSWHPKWIYFLLLLGLLPLLIAALIVTKRAKLRAPLCAAHEGMWTRNTLAALVGFLVLAGTVVIAIAFSEPRGGKEWLWILPIPALIFWIVLLVIFGRPLIKPYEITDRELLLDNVHPAFIEAMVQADEDRFGERPRRERPADAYGRDEPSDAYRPRDDRDDRYRR